jgi:hypothetical protein
VSRSACFTHSFSVWPVQPILAAIDRIIAQRDGCCTSCSSIIRTARTRTSGENVLVVLLDIAPASQALEPPTNPGRFSPGTGDQVQRQHGEACPAHAKGRPPGDMPRSAAAAWLGRRGARARRCVTPSSSAGSRRASRGRPGC